MIAFSVALAPITLARAAMQMQTQMHAAAAADMAADPDMADCHGMIKPGAGKNHPCCDEHPKAPCTDKSDCLLKCGTAMVGVLLVFAESLPEATEHIRPTDPQKPPDFASGPPAPPPRA